jgi:hypothetical protein
VALSGHQLEKVSVKAIGRIAAGTANQVLAHGYAIFLCQLPVEILPEPAQNLFTFHPLNPHETRRFHCDAALLNREGTRLVPDPHLPGVSR